MKRAFPFLTFTKDSKEAMEYYVTAFKDTEITKLETYGDRNPKNADLVYEGYLQLGETLVGFLDMGDEYPAPKATWASTILVEVDDQAEFDQAFNTLAKDGTVMMHEQNYEIYTDVAWITDKFGITWQILF